MVPANNLFIISKERMIKEKLRNLKISHFVFGASLVAGQFHVLALADDVTERSLYWSEVNTQAISMQRIGLVSNTVKEVFKSTQTPVSQALNWSRIMSIAANNGSQHIYLNRLYYSRTTTSSTDLQLTHVIERIGQNGKGLKRIFVPLRRVSGSSVISYLDQVPNSGIAVDPIRKKIYWSDIYGNSIFVVGFNGKGATKIVDGRANIRAIALDLNAASPRLFWTENSAPTTIASNTANIYSSSLSGTGITSAKSLSGNLMVGLGLDRNSTPTAAYYSSRAPSATSDVAKFTLAGAGNSVLATFDSIGTYPAAAEDFASSSARNEVYWTYDITGTTGASQLHSIYKLNTSSAVSASNPSSLVSRTVPIHGATLVDPAAATATRRARALLSQVKTRMKIAERSLNTASTEKGKARITAARVLVKQRLESISSILVDYEIEVRASHPTMTVAVISQALSLANSDQWGSISAVLKPIK
jgi:hypothetical protein